MLEYGARQLQDSFVLVVGECLTFPTGEAISDELGITYEKKDCVETKVSADVERVHIKHFF